MEVNVKLFAYLREGRFCEKKTNMEDSSCVIDVIEKCDLPVEQIRLCFVNGRHAKSDCILHDGDCVSFFPHVGG